MKIYICVCAWLFDNFVDITWVDTIVAMTISNITEYSFTVRPSGRPFSSICYICFCTLFTINIRCVYSPAHSNSNGNTTTKKKYLRQLMLATTLALSHTMDRICRVCREIVVKSHTYRFHVMYDCNCFFSFRCGAHNIYGPVEKYRLNWFHSHIKSTHQFIRIFYWNRANKQYK